MIILEVTKSGASNKMLSVINTRGLEDISKAISKLKTGERISVKRCTISKKEWNSLEDWAGTFDIVDC